MSKNIFALDKNIGARSISNKSAYIGEGNTLKLDETKHLYWKPMDIGSWSIIEHSNNSWSSENPMWSFGTITPEGHYLDLPFKKGDICYLSLALLKYDPNTQMHVDGETVTGYVRITEAISTELSDDGTHTITPGILEWEALTYFPPQRNTGPDGNPPYSASYSFTQAIPYYPFENLAFSYDSTGTKLTNLYYYQDEWGNKCYSVYDSRSNGGKYWPNYKAAENTTGVLPTDDPLWTALRIEAEQHLPVAQDGMRKSYTEGTYSFNSGEDNIAFGNNVSTLGRFNVGIRNNSFAAGARNFIRGVDAVAIGLNNTVTGQCAIGFGEGGQAIGYGSLTIGDHNVATNFYSVAGGYQCKSYGYASFTFGFFNTIKGEKSAAFGANNEVFGNNSFVAGAGNKANRSFTIIAGQQNTVESEQGGAFGYLNTVVGNRSFAFGRNNTINNRDSIVLGFSNQADYAANFIMGHRCKASHDYQIVLGRGNLPNTKGILVVGAGGYTDAEAAKDKNAIVIKNNGRVECPQGLTLYAPADANGNQKKFMLKVDNNGNLSTEQVWDS